ncbi:MAG: DinB family protein, partial [Chloroflexi bacterium]|nr:DinB family protein [Chloroflexota bacterium]
MTARVTKLIAEIETARGAFVRTLADAGAEWEQKPDADQWSVRENAEHVVRNEAFFTNEVARLTGQKPIAADEPALETPGAAIDAIFAAGAVARPVLERVTDAALAGVWQSDMTLADLLELYANHTGSHITQVKTTRHALVT